MSANIYCRSCVVQQSHHHLMKRTSTLTRLQEVGAVGETWCTILIVWTSPDSRNHLTTPRYSDNSRTRAAHHFLSPILPVPKTLRPLTSGYSSALRFCGLELDYRPDSPGQREDSAVHCLLVFPYQISCSSALLPSFVEAVADCELLA
jgi:hypothetical protein